MENIARLLKKDLNENRGCESCMKAESTHVLFIHPINMGGGVCGVFHICAPCISPDFNFGEGRTYKLIKKNQATLSI
jgi:hypothetical protein